MTPERTRLAFERLLAAVGAIEPVALRALRPGLAPDRWERLRERIGVAFPEEARPVWDLHDGSDEPGAVRFLRGWRLLAAFEIERQWKFLDDHSAKFLPFPPETPGAPYRSGMWDRGWIPIAEDGGGGSLILDTNPAPEGRVGQLLLVESAAEPWLLAPSLAEWLEELAAEYERGEWTIEHEPITNFLFVRRRDE